MTFSNLKTFPPIQLVCMTIIRKHVQYEIMYNNIIHTAVQSQKAISAYFTSNQILPFSFAEQYMHLPLPHELSQSS